MLSPLQVGDYIGFIELSVRNDHVEGADSLPVGYIEGIFIFDMNAERGQRRQMPAAAMPTPRTDSPQG